MKVIFIPYMDLSNYKTRIKEINDELKNCHDVLEIIDFNDGNKLIIVDTVSRKEKLEKLNEKSNEKLGKKSNE